MTFEVIGSRFGELRLGDVRAGVHGTVRPGGQAAVFVIGVDGEAPFIGPVALRTKRSGYAEHLALVCPSCAGARSVLYVRDGRLACAGCCRRRTRHQSERSLATWSRGGREEDRLLRMVGKGRTLETLRALVSEIIEGDLDRAGVVEESFHTAVLCVEART